MARPSRLYSLPDGTTVPSVSDVLAQCKGDYRSPHIDAAAERGSAGHALIAADLREEALPPIPPELAHPWAAWRQWSAAHWVVPEAIEAPMAVGGMMGFGGTPDCIGLVDGIRTVIDFKIATARNYDNFTQIGAYAGLWGVLHPDRPVARGLVLRLDPNGGGPEEHWIDGDALMWASTGFMGLCAHWHAHRVLLADQKARRQRRAA
jgi:hypothetical protein